MGTTENLKDIIAKQKEALQELESTCSQIEHSDTIRENAKLKVQLEQLQQEYTITTSRITALTTENTELKSALYEQIYNEKVKLLNSNTQKIAIYFKSRIEGEQNQLKALESSVRAKIDTIAATLHQHSIDATDELYTKLNELENLLADKLDILRLEKTNSCNQLQSEQSMAVEDLKQQEITSEQVREIAKKNNMERFVGLNLLNGLGVLLIVIGAITAARHSYMQLPDTIKAMLIFVFGAAMLVAGEFLNRKKPNVFSLGITAGGVAILYVALVASYFGLEILGVYPALLICVMITALAILLSTRYDSQIIMLFALIGGYIPIFAIDTYGPIIYGTMVYFIVLNFLALILSFSKKWRASTFLGLFLNILGTVYITVQFNDLSTTTAKIVVIFYVIFAFFTYTLIPIISTYRTKSKFLSPDFLLLATNTFFSSIIMYNLFYRLDLLDFTGAMAIMFAVTYLLLARLVEEKFPVAERKIRALFYLTGFAFLVLVIPLQFGRDWLSLGWLSEGIALILYGIFYKEPLFKRIGYMIGALCLAAFILFDFLQILNHYLLTQKYLAITLGSIIVLVAELRNQAVPSKLLRAYKYGTLINVWLYIIYIFGYLQPTLIDIYGRKGLYNIEYLLAAAFIVSTFVMAYSLPRIKLLADSNVKAIANAMYIIAIFRLIILNMTRSPVRNLPDAPLTAIVVATVILLAISVLSIFALRDVVMHILSERKISLEPYPLIISAYFVVILTQNLIVQYKLHFSSIAISIIYILAALGWIIYGFIKRYAFIRRFGLGLAIFTVIKLFLVDLYSLTQGYKIISYLTLGSILIAISYVYQYFNKRLELKAEVSANVQKDN